MSQQLFEQTVIAYCAAEKAMQLAKALRFPHHSVVKVSSPQYSGFGIALVEDGCRPENLRVMLDNGNTWEYLASACTPGIVRKAWPLWIRRKQARWIRDQKKTKS